MVEMNDLSDRAAGLAALAICESLMLAIAENGVLTVDEIRGALQDAATSHRDASTDEGDAEIRAEAARLIDRIISTSAASRLIDQIISTSAVIHRRHRR
jgi:hypothetical protein